MRICLITPQFFPVPAVRGGAVEQLITMLVEENEIEHKMDITCVSVWDEKAEAISKKMKHTEFIYIPLREEKNQLDCKKTDERFVNYMEAVYEKIKERTFDYIVICGGNVIGYKEMMKKFPYEKNIVYLHGTALMAQELQEVYKYFIVVSDYVGNIFKRSNLLTPDRIKVLKNGIDYKSFVQTISQEEKRALREKYKIQQEDITIMFCGRTVKEKGIKELLLAFKNMKNRDNCKVVIVGNSNFANEVQTEYDKQLKEIAKEVNDKVIFTGFIPNKELYKIHQIADIAVVPSMFEEAFCLAVVEAMASGLPVITTDSGAIPEIVDDTCAFMIKRDEELIQNMTEKLELLSQDEELRRKMGQNGKKIAEKYNEHHYYLEFCKTIEEIDKNNK